MKFCSLKAFPLWIVLCFLLSCAGTKPEQKPPSPPVEEKKVEQAKGEESAPSPLPKEPPQKSIPQTTSPSSIPESPRISPPSPPSTPPPQPTPAQRVTKVVWESVNLREGPGLNFKVIGSLKKGTALSVLEEKGNWLKVRFEDGKEAWVSKLATSEAPKSETPKSAPTKPSKPNPM